MQMKEWVRLPTEWIEGGGLKNFRWNRGQGADYIAALMCLMVLAQHADFTTGEASVTYDMLERATFLSRPKISAGLKCLVAAGLIEPRVENRRSRYKLVQGVKARWGAFPARKLYNESGQLTFLRDFTLRKQAELNALKLLFLFVARRNVEFNLARISYDKIVDYAGISRDKVSTAISLLISLGLIHVDRMGSKQNESAVANAYRIAHLLPFRHAATTPRDRLENSFEDVVPF